MSARIEVLGWCLIALGTCSAHSAIRTLTQLIRLGKNEAIKPDLRRDAWRNVGLGSVTLTCGVFWVSYRWTHDALIWLPVACAAILVIWNVGSWFRFRNKNGQAAGQPH
jgi:hypothetical protein